MSAEKPKHILVIEDDKYILDVLTELLVGEGYLVSQATNGQEGIDYLRSAQSMPNLIFLDLMMPVKDGAAFRQEQEAHPVWSSVPVVLMSAGAHLESKMLSIGLSHCLKKPLDLETVLETAKKYCS